MSSGEFQIIIVLHSIFFTFSVVLNGFLLFCIFKFTPKSTSSFSLVMIVHAMLDLTGTASCFMSMSRILNLETRIVLISHGPCHLASTRLCYLSYDGYLSAAACVFYTNMCSFRVRYFILKEGSIKRWHVVRLLCAFVGPHNLALFVLFAFSQIPDAQAAALIAKYTAYNTTGLVITGTLPITSIGIGYAHFLCIICIIPAYIVTWKLRSRTVHTLDAMAPKMSVTTVMMQQRFVKLLTLQALTPLLPVTSAFAYVVSQTLQLHHPVLEASDQMYAELPAIVNPIIVFVYLPTYSRVFREFLNRCKTPALVGVGIVSHQKSFISSTTTTSEREG
ncbi:hypothetical protein PRIPAC_90589 [Pristionchus pacificus]|uniref:G protein-coupled receptor n=1 Tax=Pristionchus pacificus TaxID=54126 RepID=A0A454Y5C8_PRIPA|nr:hypothetical protein PRIPAC_90589 [Pristionchus pacificus]|eukprot:PDM82509.1 G protein-coupled receptor [Pristionchus pacificus]